MTEPEFYENEQPNEQQDQNGDGGRNWRLMREKGEKYDSLFKEHEQLQRENAFLKAGIPDTPQGRLLQKAYDGEPTAEAIRQAAVEFGVLDAADEGVPGEEFAALERVDAASQGSSFTPPKAPDMNALLRQASGRR